MPEYVFCGTVTVMVGVTANVPTPVAAAALKNLLAVGGEGAAGTVIGKVSELLGATQMPPLAQSASAIVWRIHGEVGLPGVAV